MNIKNHKICNLIKLFFLLFFIMININFFKKFSINENILLKGRKYLNRCLKGKLINRRIYTEYVNPRVTIIIPVYNCQNSIKQAIRSIQNQKMIDIEIMLVNDKSNDDSIKIIKNIQKTDKRIVIIILIFSIQELLFFLL